MIRWSYLVPRLCLLGIAAAVCYLVLPGLLRWSLIQAGQRVTGAKVEVAALRLVPLRAQLQLIDVQFADPSSPMRNLVQAESTVLELDTAALLRRKLVVHEGRIGGVRIGRPRETSGQLDPAQPSQGTAATWGDSVQEMGARWLDRSVETLQTDLENELHSVRLGRELAERWPRDYERLEQQSQELRSRVENLVQLVEQRPPNPLRAAEAYQQAAGELDAVRRQSRELVTQLEQLRQQAALDRRAAAEAREHDERLLREKLQTTQLDPETLSRYLLGPELQPRVREALAWLEWARGFVPADSPPPTSVAGRGMRVLLPGLRVTPDVQIRRLVLDGEGQLNQQPVPFAGTLTGVSSAPALMDQPVVLRLQSGGAAAGKLEAVLDRTGPAPCDQIRINCPGLAQPERQLGKPDQLAVTVASGTVDVSAELELVGDTVRGTLRFRQEPVAITPHVKADLAGGVLNEQLAAAAAEVRQVQAELTLDGTLQKPRWKLHSNLGPELAQAWNRALTREVDQRRQQLAERANQVLAEQLNLVSAELARHEQAVREKLQISDGEVARLARELAERLGGPDKLLGHQLPLDKLPLNKLLRR